MAARHVTVSPGTAVFAFFEREYLPRHLAAASLDTVAHYRRVLRLFRRYLGRSPTLPDLTDAHLLGYCRWRLDAHRSNSTVSIEFSRLAVLWKWAAQHRYLDEYPDVRCPVKRLGRSPTAWRPEQLDRLVESCATMKGAVSGIPAPLYYRALALVALDTGFRRGALFRLEWSDVDWDLPALIARAEWSKTSRDEVVGIAPDTVSALRAIEEPARKMIFPRDSSWQTFYRRWSSLLKAAGLPATSRDKLQKLRRTCGTWAEIVTPGGGQKILGHSSPSITARHYLDSTMLPNANLAARFPRPTSGDGRQRQLF